MHTAFPFIKLAMAGFLAGLLIVAGCKQQQGPGGSSQAKPMPEVAVVIMRTEPVTLSTELAGRIASPMVADVRPQVSGIIEKRLFTEGGEVMAGDPLYQIDPAPFQAALASARATLAKAEANGYSLRLKAERYRKLTEINAVSRQDYDDASAELKQNEAEIAAGKAAVETARINLAYTRITAPISGRIGRSAVTPGALVTANQTTALASIQQLDPVYADMTQSSAELLQLKRSLKSGFLKIDEHNQATVQLTLEDGSAYSQSGLLKFSEVTVEPSTGSVTLRAQFANPEQLLLPGMFVRARVMEGVREEALLVPQRGVSRDTTGKAVVLLAGENDVVERRIIATERAIGDRWLVSQGLAAGDRVIVEGLQRIRPGATVKVVPFAGEKAPGSGNQPAAAR